MNPTNWEWPSRSVEVLVAVCHASSFKAGCNSTLRHQYYYYRFEATIRSPLQGWYQKWYYWSSGGNMHFPCSCPACGIHAKTFTSGHWHLPYIQKWWSNRINLSNRLVRLKIQCAISLKKVSLFLSGQYYHNSWRSSSPCCCCWYMLCARILRVVQGLLSHVGSQGNVKFYACVGLLLLQLPNLTVLPIFEIKNNTLQSPGCPPTSFRN